jgi:hypothetical protein
MKIKNKARFVVGIFDILISIMGLAILIIHHRTRGFSLLGFCFACGIFNILNSIETKTQRQKRKEELQVMAKMLGWDKEDGDVK